MIVPDIVKLNKSQLTEKFIKIHYPDFHTYIIESYPAELSWSEKLYWYVHKLTEHPKCPVCGNPTKFGNINLGYRHHCSLKCSNSDKDKIQKQQQTTLMHYGVLNPSQNDEIKRKKQETCNKHFDGGYSSQYILNKRKETCRSKYGNPNYNGLEKARQTWLTNLGVDHPSKSKMVMEKKRNTNIKKFGIPWTIMLDEARSYSNNSNPNRYFAKILENNGITYEREFHIENRSYDFKIGDILIEIDPTWTHNIYQLPFQHQGISKTYHKNKTELATKYNYRCIHVWDWDDISKILNLLIPRQKIYARKCQIKEVSKHDTDEFLNQYHIQNTCRGQHFSYGLYYQDELLQIMTFGKPRYNKKYNYELLRLCSKPGVCIVGGSARLFNHFIKMQNPPSIISYCDLAKFTGDVYIKLGFELDNNAEPSIHWCKGKHHISNSLLLQRGFDQLFKTNYGVGTSNFDLMIQHKFLPVPDCGQARYIWIQKKELN